jgi:bifunctional non-homologous end joining protein LigD
VGAANWFRATEVTSRRFLIWPQISRRRFPFTKSAVLDGEVVCLDADGHPQFRELLFHRSEPCFFAFDMLFCEGKDLRLITLVDRKAELRRTLATAPKTSRIRYADHVETKGSGLFELVCERDLEGIRGQA